MEPNSTSIPGYEKREVTRDDSGTLRIDGDEWTGKNLDRLKWDAARIVDRIEADGEELSDLRAIIAFLESEQK